MAETLRMLSTMTEYELYRVENSKGDHSESPLGDFRGPFHYGGLLRPATPPFLLSPLIPPVFTCF